MMSAPMQNAVSQATDPAATARNAAENARDIARAQREAAQAQRDAAQAQRDAAQAQREAQGGTNGSENLVITVTRDGKTVTLNGSQEEVFSTLGIQQNGREESDGPYVVGALSIISTAVVLIVGLVLRHRGKRNVAQQPVRDAEMTQRLARMENGIESVAVEVERISEGQRFTTRLLSDRAPQEVPRG